MPFGQEPVGRRDLLKAVAGAGATPGLANVVSSLQTATEAAYWPACHWRTAQPESQGVDSQFLTAAID